MTTVKTDRFMINDETGILESPTYIMPHPNARSAYGRSPPRSRDNNAEQFRTALRKARQQGRKTPHKLLTERKLKECNDARRNIL